MFKAIGSFIADIIKQVLIKIITFSIMLILIIFAIKIFFGIDVLSLFGL